MGSLGFDEAFVHGMGPGFPELEDLAEGVAAFVEVAAEAAEESDVARRIDEDGEVEQLAQAWALQYKEAFDDNDGRGAKGDGLGSAGEAGEFVAWGLDGAAGGEVAEVRFEQVELEGVGVVEVGLLRLGGGQVGEVAVVPVLLDDGGGAWREAGEP